MVMLLKTHFLAAIFFILLASVFILTGCVSEGAAFGLGSGSLHENVVAENNKNEKPEVYGPPQIIYRIDDNRYFTLENYTRCENGQTFYNNKEKGIHVMVANTSGYLFKGRFFWLSTRDDYLAFPATADTNTSRCVGADKGCLNSVIVTTDGGKTLHGVPYGGHTTSPTEVSKTYDMLVYDDGFYMIYYWDGIRDAGSASVDRWKFHINEESTRLNGYPGVTGPKYQKSLPMDDISGVKQTVMQCDRALEP